MMPCIVGVILAMYCSHYFHAAATTEEYNTPSKYLTQSIHTNYNHTSRHLTTQSKDSVAICSLFLNEDATLVEWIEFHLMIGVSKIFLYHLDNHAHKNRWRQILWPYVSRGQVQLHAQVLTYLGQWSFRQVASLQHCYDTYRNDFHWMAFIDVDEFIVPRNPTMSLPYLLRLYNQESGLVIPWRTFGPTRILDQSRRGLSPRITELTNATVYDQRDSVIYQMGGTIKTIVNTRHRDADHCYFVRTGGPRNKRRFIDFAHNCLYRAPSPPVDEKFRPVNETWVLPYAASSNIIQLNHYFARTCSSFLVEKAKSRLKSIQSRYGKNPPPWFSSRLGIGLGNTTAEKCATLLDAFNTTDTSILELGRKLWSKLDTATNTSLYTPPPRNSCQACLPRAHCVDLLQRSSDGTSSMAECVCRQPFVGDGRTFCGNVTWAASVKTPQPDNFSHLLSAPDGNKYDSNWVKRPRSAEYTIYFGPSGARFSGVRMILIYQSLTPALIKTLQYTHTSILGEDITDIDLHNVQSSGRRNPSFMMISVGRVELSSVLIRFDTPVQLGGVGIVVV